MATMTRYASFLGISWSRYPFPFLYLPLPSYPKLSGDHKMKPIRNANAMTSGSVEVDLSAGGGEELELGPPLPDWLKGSLEEGPDEDVAAALLVFVEVEVLLAFDEVAIVVAGSDDVVCVLVAEETLLDAEELTSEDELVLVAVAVADAELVVPASGVTPLFVPNPILAWSKSNTVYTFFKNTSPRIQSLRPNAWWPMILLWQPLPLCLPT